MAGKQQQSVHDKALGDSLALRDAILEASLAHVPFDGWSERALKAGDELGGHLVTGHVDDVATVSSITPAGDSLCMTFTPPPELMTAIASKGSITIDGVSLTVNELSKQDFAVNLIPHTQQNTTLGALITGQRVNLEIDLLARYVARALGKA